MTETIEDIYSEIRKTLPVAPEGWDSFVLAGAAAFTITIIGFVNPTHVDSFKVGAIVEWWCGGWGYQIRTGDCSYISDDIGDEFKTYQEAIDRVEEILAVTGYLPAKTH